MFSKTLGYINIIDKEIEWCESNRDKGMYDSDNPERNKSLQDAFISGLKQAKSLLMRIDN